MCRRVTEREQIKREILPVLFFFFSFGRGLRVTLLEFTYAYNLYCFVDDFHCMCIAIVLFLLYVFFFLLLCILGRNFPPAFLFVIKVIRH